MNQKLSLISFIISITGILLLLSLSHLLPVPEKTISQLTERDIDQIIKISGKITNSRQISEDFYILTLNDSTGPIQVLCSEEIKEKQIKVIGKIQKYKGNLQIQAEKIIK
jgi:aspartyl-tRNA synthetase